MLLVSSAKHTKSTVMVGILSRLNDENKPILYNTGRHVIENVQFAKIQLTGSGNNTLVEALNSGEWSNSHSKNLEWDITAIM